MVRPFYVTGQVDGHETRLSAGPRRLDGGMSLHVTQRDQGSIVDAFRIESRATGDGHLITEVIDDAGRVVASKVTVR